MLTTVRSATSSYAARARAVAAAAVETIRDGTLLAHVGASVGRVAFGTVLGVLVAVPLGIAMGVNRGVATFFTPLLRFFSVLAGIATEDETEHLDLEPGSPVLHISRRAFCRENVVEVTRSVYRADRYTLWVPVLRPEHLR